MTKIKFTNASQTFSENTLFIKIGNLFEKITAFDKVRLKYEKKEFTPIHIRGEVNADGDVEISLYDISDDIDLYSGYISLEDIPYDLDEMLDEDEFHFLDSESTFDKAMIRNGFFDYGVVRRAHRIITDKVKSLSYNEVRSALTGLSEDEINNIETKKSYEYKIKEMNQTADEYGFIIIDSDIQKYIDYGVRKSA